MSASLISRGYQTHKAVATPDSSAFIIALPQAITFSVFITISQGSVIIGLIIGGVLAAPFAAEVCGSIHPKMRWFWLGC